MKKINSILTPTLRPRLKDGNVAWLSVPLVVAVDNKWATCEAVMKWLFLLLTGEPPVPRL